jgi:hypothetical protein
VGDDRPLAGNHQIVPAAIAFHEQLRSGRDRQQERLSPRAVPERSLTVATSPGFEMRAAPIALEVAQRFVADDDHIAASAAIAAVGTASRHMGFPPEADAAIAAAACTDKDPRTIEHTLIVRDAPWPR